MSLCFFFMDLSARTHFGVRCKIKYYAVRVEKYNVRLIETPINRTFFD